MFCCYFFEDKVYLVLRRLFKMRANILRLCALFLYQVVVHAQEAVPANRPVFGSLAVGGMVQGLLDMQIRPQGGFHEERYKKIFPNDANVALATTHVDRRHTATRSRPKDIVSEDGKLLAEAAAGQIDSPCFDHERIVRNRLLLLVCTLQLANSQSLDKHDGE